MERGSRSRSQRAGIVGSIVALMAGLMLVFGGAVGGLPEVLLNMAPGAVVLGGSLIVLVLILTTPQKNRLENAVQISRALEAIPNLKLRKNMNEFSEETVSALAMIINNLNKGPVELRKSQLDRLLKIMFKTKADYVGIDYNKPSQFYSVYPDYLASHKISLKNHTDGNRGYRIMVSTPDDMERDSTTQLFAEFYHWHQTNQVGLFMVSPEAITAVLDEVEIDPARCNNGIGLWKNQFMVLFGKTKQGDMTRVEILDDSNLDFGRVRTLFERLEPRMTTIKEAGVYKIISQDLATDWTNYVNPEERWENIKEFLYHFVSKYKGEKTILDAASGIGTEYQMMIQDGFAMDANEYQKELVDAGKRYAAEHGFETEYEPMRHDWRVMTKYGMKNKYGAVLMVGNSIRVLPDREGQRQSMKSFYEALQEGGTLIIDERNYERVAELHEKVAASMADPGNAKLFDDLRGVNTPSKMYRSTTIKSVPTMVNLDEKSMGLTYYRTDSDNSTMSDVLRNKIHEWRFFHYESMEELLRSTGFRSVKKYADYKLDREVVDGSHDDASMYVYIATK